MLDLSARTVILPAPDVEASAESATFGPKQDHANVGALLQPAKIVLQREDHLLVHRVEFFGTIERQYLNRAALFDEDGLGHSCFPDIDKLRVVTYL